MRKSYQKEKRWGADEPDDDEIAGCDLSLGGPHLPARRMEGELDSNALWGSQNRVFAKAEPEFKINAYFHRF